MDNNIDATICHYYEQEQHETLTKMLIHMKLAQNTTLQNFVSLTIKMSTEDTKFEFSPRSFNTTTTGNDDEKRNQRRNKLFRRIQMDIKVDQS